jgi:hypothetical protein
MLGGAASRGGRLLGSLHYSGERRRRGCAWMCVDGGGAVVVRSEGRTGERGRFLAVVAVVVAVAVASRICSLAVALCRQGLFPHSRSGLSSTRVYFESGCEHVGIMPSSF